MRKRVEERSLTSAVGRALGFGFVFVFVETLLEVIGLPEAIGNFLMAPGVEVANHLLGGLHSLAALLVVFGTNVGAYSLLALLAILTSKSPQPVELAKHRPRKGKKRR